MNASRTGEVEIPFGTSGHLGPTVRWWRTRGQLRLEVELVMGCVFPSVEHVVNFAPPQHLFGHLYGSVLPEVAGIGVTHLWQDHLARPELPHGKRTLFVCLPSSWIVMRSLAGHIRELPSAVALHGAGPTTRVTDHVMSALSGSGFRGVKIFGSTETGGIATQDLRPEEDGGGAWSLLPDVKVVQVASGEQTLVVRSSRIGRREDMARAPDEWELDDLVSYVDDRSFVLLGRRSRLVKVNGGRCDLGAVERALLASLPDLDLVCVGVHDLVGAEHYELFYAAPDNLLGEAEVWVTVRKTLRGIPLPRRVHRLPAIPRTVTGKVKVHDLCQAGGLADVLPIGLRLARG